MSREAPDGIAKMSLYQWVLFFLSMVSLMGASLWSTAATPGRDVLAGVGKIVTFLAEV